MNAKVRALIVLMTFVLLACNAVTSSVTPTSQPATPAQATDPPEPTTAIEPTSTIVSAPFFHATFDSVGRWGSGQDEDVEGGVEEGIFRLHVIADSGIFWSTAGENFGEGTYELVATHVSGPLDNGYGLMFHVDNNTDSFYLFEVSSDGFVWIGACVNGCEDEVTPLVEDGWFESSAVKQGLNQTNNLRAEANGGGFILFVNDQQVGQFDDNRFTGGDIGLLVETLGEGGVTVNFDNVTFQPAGE